MDNNPIFIITRGDKNITIYSNGHADGLIEMLGDEMPIYIENHISGLESFRAAKAILSPAMSMQAEEGLAEISAE